MPEGGFDIEVLIESAAWRKMPQVTRTVARAAEAALTVALPVDVPVSLCVALVTDAAIARLNRDFLGSDRPTDVLAFPQLSGDVRGVSRRLRGRPRSRAAVALGDVAVARSTSARGAREAGLPLRYHLAHLVVHGVMHLLGHDHAEAKEKARMRNLERKALARLGIGDPYRRPTPKTKARESR